MTITDMNFDESFEIIREKKYYRLPFDRAVFRLPETRERVKIMLECVEKYIEQRKR